VGDSRRRIRAELGSEGPGVSGPGAAAAGHCLIHARERMRLARSCRAVAGSAMARPDRQEQPELRPARARHPRVNSQGPFPPVQRRRAGWSSGRSGKGGGAALDCRLDTTTATGELVASTLAMAARFEWRRISERQIEKHRELRRAGRLRGHAAVSAALADRLRSLREEGLSYAAIADGLNREGVATAQGGKRWYAASVRSAVLTRERELAAQAVA
jgi:hypothetical protein